jgi:hypothetical protein
MAQASQKDGNPFALFAAELMRLQDSMPKRSNRFNPRPAGRIQPGSSTDLVLTYLRSVSSFQTRKQIMAATGLPEKSCNWALLYLRSIELVVYVNDVHRNMKYLRYRAVVE